MIRVRIHMSHQISKRKTLDCFGQSPRKDGASGTVKRKPSVFVFASPLRRDTESLQISFETHEHQKVDLLRELVLLRHNVTWNKEVRDDALFTSRNRGTRKAPHWFRRNRTPHGPRNQHLLIRTRQTKPCQTVR